ncbi:MAG: hypothetical protein H6736_09015 [Alphaproteobacteria bacterium]|nr:hypothetical protein [Alphaproteobacteria bacterium]MCB9691943.1 hypothetical protein [Alphaproteobacteria bacterium]
MIAFLLAATAGAGGGLLAHAALRRVEQRRLNALPALPSHGEAVVGAEDPGVRFFAAVHDLTMTVTEAWNTTRIRGGSVEERIKRDHLAGVADRVHAGADELLRVLEPYRANAELASKARGALDGLWTYSSQDHHHVEHYTETVVDGDGQTATHTRSREVYQSTDHWYAVAPERIPAVLDAVRDWLRDAERRSFPRLGIAGRRVDLGQLEGVERSFLERLVRSTVTGTDDEVPADTLAEIASQWSLGSRIDDDLLAYIEGLAEARASAARLSECLPGIQATYHYNTTSQIEDGPESYRATLGALEAVRTAEKAWADVLAVVQGAREAATTLVAWASDPSIIEDDREYARVAAGVYQLAFPASTLDLVPWDRTWLPAVGAAGVGLSTALGVLWLFA